METKPGESQNVQENASYGFLSEGDDDEAWRELKSAAGQLSSKVNTTYYFVRYIII